MFKKLMMKISAQSRQPAVVSLRPEELAAMLRMVSTTRPDEIGCDECFEQLDRFAEMKLTGKGAAEAMPLVQDHLDRCNDCREEFEMLLLALQANTESA